MEKAELYKNNSQILLPLIIWQLDRKMMLMNIPIQMYNI